MSPFGLMSGSAMGGLGLMQPQPGIFDDPEKADALRMALLQAGLGIMSAQTGGNLGAAIGQGGMQGLQAYQGQMQQNKMNKRQAAQDQMEQAQFGMQQKKFEAEQAQTADQAARRKAFEEAVKGAYKLDDQGNVIGIDQAKYQAALAMLDPDQAAKMFYQSQKEAQPYFTPVYDAQQGLGAFNARTGQTTFQGGIVRPQDDPSLQAKITAEKARKELEATTQTQAQIDLPAAEAAAAQSIDVIDRMIDHPGRKAATGFSSVNPLNKLPGSDAYNFEVLRKQASGQVFMNARQMLKGGGAITDFESQKAEEAASRLDKAQSEDEFLVALKDLKAAIATGVEKLRKRGQPGAPSMLTPNQPQGWGIRKVQ